MVSHIAACCACCRRMFTAAVAVLGGSTASKNARWAGCLAIYEKDSSCQISVNQPSAPKSVSFGGSVTFTCTTGSSVYGDMAWYQQRPGQTPTLMIYDASTRYGDTPSRFSGSGSGTSYSMTISGVQPEDAGHYYCQQYQSWPLTQ
ncbi:KV315 protein, partial [Polypterus senegalus]